MIFEGRFLSEITDEDIKQLVREHVVENQNLEYKLMLNHKTDEEKYEVLCDITSLANAGGGYLVVGIRDDGKGKAQKFEDVEHVERVAKSIQSLCVEYISERIDGIEWDIREIDGLNILIFRVPESVKAPHMVTYKNNTHFVTRYNDNKREMTIGEIRSYFTDNVFNKRLVYIEEVLRNLLNGQKIETDQKLINMLVEDKISDLNVEDGAVISKASLNKSIKEIGNVPFFRISITPEYTNRNFINVDLPKVTGLFKNPPNQRSAGWNMEGSYTETKRFSEGLLRKGVMEDILILKQNGFMEFRIKIDHTFCWNQPEEEFKKRPRLYPYPVVEYPLSFLQLYKYIIDTLQIEMSYIVSMEYYNIKGFVLYPSHPSSIEFNIHGNYVSPYDKENLFIPPFKVEKEFVPDKITFELVKYLYNTFGYTEDKIPFYNKDSGQFQIE